MYIHTYIHTYRQTDRQTDRQIDRQTDRQTGRQADIYITTNLEHTPHAALAPPLPTQNMQLPPAGCLQFKTNIEKAIKIPNKSNIQGNDIMEKSFTHCTIDVRLLVILICNEKLLLPCHTKTNINKRDFSQT